jgi:hypothetical protein
VQDLIVVAYYERPAIKGALGYDPDAWTTAMVTRRARWSEAIANHHELLITPHEPPPLTP